MERWYSISEACEFAGVSRRTIYNWYGQGKLETRRTPGGSIRINPESLALRDQSSPLPSREVHA